MRALLIDAEVKSQIAEITKLAALNPFPLDDLREASSATGDALIRWKMRLDDFTMPIPFGFLVTYTHEQQEIGTLQHISISVDAAGRIPNKAAITMICSEFGIDLAKAIKVWPEEYETGCIVVNILAPV